MIEMMIDKIKNVRSQKFKASINNKDILKVKFKN